MKMQLKIISAVRTYTILLFLMLGYAVVNAQSKAEPSPKEQAPAAEPTAPQKETSPPTESDAPKKETVKAVPVAKDQNAKPARIGNARPNGARPSVARPARSTRPTGRVVRPGRAQ